MYRTPASKPVPYKKSRFAGLRRRTLACLLKYRLFAIFTLACIMLSISVTLVAERSLHITWFTMLIILIFTTIGIREHSDRDKEITPLIKYPQKFLARIWGHGFYPFT